MLIRALSILTKVVYVEIQAGSFDFCPDPSPLAFARQFVLLRFVVLLLKCCIGTLLNLTIAISWQDGQDGDNKQSTADMTVFVSFLAKITLHLIDVKQLNLTLVRSVTISQVSSHLNLFTTGILKHDYFESWNQYFFFPKWNITRLCDLSINR